MAILTGPTDNLRSASFTDEETSSQWESRPAGRCAAAAEKHCWRMGDFAGHNALDKALDHSKRLADPEIESAWHRSARSPRRGRRHWARVKKRPVGRYLYWKRMEAEFRLCKVRLCPLHVTDQLARWPEEDEGLRHWFSPRRRVRPC